MKAFWENIKRFPMFLIVSCTGLMILLFDRKSLKDEENRLFNSIFKISLFLGLIISFSLIFDL